MTSLLSFYGHSPRKELYHVINCFQLQKRKFCKDHLEISVLIASRCCYGPLQELDLKGEKGMIFLLV